MAATSIAARVAHETGTRLGEEVGYTIRFEDCSHPTRTRLKYLTPGMLFRECMRDPLLSRYSVVMVDEAHERDAYTDLVVSLLRKIRSRRPDLRVVVASATIDAEAFARFFGADDPNTRVAIAMLEGRTFPVEIAYAQRTVPDYVHEMVEVIWRLHFQEPAGDLLAFVTGQEEIEAVLQALADRSRALPPGSLPMHLLPLYAGVSAEQQAAVFEPAPRGSRKVVVATNVAEASVTIDGIRYVVDCGFTKVKTYDAQLDMDVLAVVPESRAAAAQRAGRAGRTAPGKCIRLFPESQLAALPRTSAPELVRCDLAPYLLQLKALGVENVARFAFVPPAPSAQMVAQGLEYLAALGALDEHARLTRVGERLAEAPLPPPMARALLAAAEFGCAQEMLTIAAMTTVASPFTAFEYGPTMDVHAEVSRRKFVAEEGDHLTLLNVYNAFVHPRIGKQSPRWAARYSLNYAALRRAHMIRGQLERYYSVRWALPVHSCGGDHVRLRRCLVVGLFRNAARASDDGSYRGARHQATLHVHPSSVLFTRRAATAQWVVFSDVMHTSKAFMRDVTVVDPEWLTELAPHYYEAVQGRTGPSGS